MKTDKEILDGTTIEYKIPERLHGIEGNGHIIITYVPAFENGVLTGVVYKFENPVITKFDNELKLPALEDFKRYLADKREELESE